MLPRDFECRREPSFVPEWSRNGAPDRIRTLQGAVLIQSTDDNGGGQLIAQNQKLE
jgi:hypothetical protein